LAIRCLKNNSDRKGESQNTKVKKSLESDYPRPQAGAFRPIHGYATAISC